MQAVDVDLWIWSLESPPQPVAALAQYLTDEEEARAARFVNPAHGQQFRAGRGQLRVLLGDYIGVSPRDVQFAYNAQGKPSLADGPSFNLSHSGGVAALGVIAADIRIGVDIEAFRTVEDSVARRFFAPSEYATLSALPPAQWEAGFFRCWTRKEAVVKGCGPGLSMPLDSFDVTLGPDDLAHITRLEGGRPADWRMVHLDLGARMVGAIAVESMGREVRVRSQGPMLPRGVG